jgi:omega-6 fatty acid desaturase (delta-12 desaturase)
MTATSTTEQTSGHAKDKAGKAKPTGLKPVLDIIPESCYQRSTARGLFLVARDFAVYGLALWGLASTNNPLFLIPLWLLAGMAVSGLFVLGHDAAHQALFDSKRLNDIIGRLTMLPSWHATEQWIFGHNRVHHGYTLRQGMDFVWHPITAEQWDEMGTLARLRHRFEWGPIGSGAYYLREVWWNKMVRFKPPKRWAKAMNRDRALVAAFIVATLVATVVAGGGIAGWGGGLWLWIKMFVIPFLLFCQSIGWVVYVHHIDPEIRWWPRREWNRFRGQVEGTTVLWGPPGWELFFHWIMVHLPHHVDMRIPCYKLPEAAAAIKAAYPDDVDERKISIRNYLRATRECKIHDFEAGAWSRYPAA